MSYQSSYSPHDSTPRSITILIFAIVITSLCSAALEPLMVNVFHISGPQEFLGLSLWGMTNYYLWQPISCLFIQSEGYGIGFFFLINLTFSMYMLWLFGTHLVDHYGAGAFLRLFFTSGILASLMALLVISLLRPHSGAAYIIAGVTPSLLAVFVVWAILHQDSSIFLFFLFPLKTKWLLALVVSLSILIPLSELNIMNFVYYMTGILSGYFFCTLFYEQNTPFPFMTKMDEFFIALGRQFRNKIQKYSSSKNESKIVDIKSGKKPLDDDAFVDEMLSKISHYGESSLSWEEKERLRKISEKKMNDNK